jgi:hypothetical protein
MNSATRLLNLRNLEITADALVLHFHEESTVIPLSEIRSYRFNWYLHDPIFAKKWWFLVLTVTLRNGDEESGHITSVKFNYLGDDSKLRKDIETKIAHAIDTGLWQASVSAKNDSSLPRGDKPSSSLQRSNY